MYIELTELSKYVSNGVTKPTENKILIPLDIIERIYDCSNKYIKNKPDNARSYLQIKSTKTITWYSSKGKHTSNIIILFVKESFQEITNKLNGLVI